MSEDLLPIRGVPASPYTRKMLALLRYRRIPYRFLQGNLRGDQEHGDLPQPFRRLRRPAQGARQGRMDLPRSQYVRRLHRAG